MNFKLIRTNEDGLTLTTPNIDDLGLILVCQQTTSNEHSTLLKKLESHLNIEADVNVFYEWKTTSIFIFDISEFDKTSRQDLRHFMDTMVKTKYGFIFKGETNRASLTDLYINKNGKTINVGKQFAQLLSIEEGSLS